jgi:transposase
MISAATIAALEERKLEYILGARERTDKLVREVVLADDTPYVPLALEKRGKTTEYGAKAVKIGKLRYIVCVNHNQAAKDAADRAAILENLERQLKRGDKTLVGNAGYRRYLRTLGPNRFAVDHDKVAADAKFDGIFVLRTNIALDPLAVMRRYKQLWTVEQVFRTTKDILGTRPIFHKRDETIRGHVFCSFLALVLKKDLTDRLGAHGAKLEWADVLADLDRVQEVMGRRPRRPRSCPGG